MPTYEYRCKACGHQLEVVQAFTDDALTTCEACGEEQLRKVFAAPGIAFKGAGFYKTDSRGSSSSSSSSGNGDKAGSESSSSSSASDSSSASTSSDNGSKKSDSPASTTPAAPASKPA